MHDSVGHWQVLLILSKIGSICSSGIMGLAEQLTFADTIKNGLRRVKLKMSSSIERLLQKLS